MRDAPIAAGEFRSVRRDVPRWPVMVLGLTTLAYGVVLTLVLPWMVVDAVRTGSLGPGWGVVITAFGGFLMLRWCVVQGLAFQDHVRRLDRAPPVLAAHPRVSILVPAYNESATIDSAIRSLVALDYPAFEVIVVDDGSSDDTFARALALQGRHASCRVTVLRKPNGGKWSALNLAFAHARGELILCVDADSRLAPDALAHLVPRLLEPGVAGVSGQVTIRNRNRLLARFQALEYLLGNGGIRTALSAAGLVTVVPGPIGLYRRAALEAVARAPWNLPGPDGIGRVYGPLSPATFAEDFELSLSVLALGGRIVYEPAANAYTTCPEDVAALISQRYRWMRGTWQVFHIYMRAMRSSARRNNPGLDCVMLALYPLDIYVAPLLNFVFWTMLACASASSSSLPLMLAWIGSVTVLNTMAGIVYALVHDDELDILTLMPGLDLYQSLLVNASWVIAAVDAVRGSKMRWS